MRLRKIDNKFIDEVLKQNDSNGGNDMNRSLMRLFKEMNDESNTFEVSIKVSALNQLYSTAIKYIKPVVKSIVDSMPESHSEFSEQQYVDLVDKISCAKWVSPITGKTHKRNNLSFASKYIHFISDFKTPIYDSFIWIILQGYLSQEKKEKLSFSPPTNYMSFYCSFNDFKTTYNLHKYTNYQIDKFLWQYGKNQLDLIMKNQSISLDKARTVLIKELRYNPKK